MADSTQKKGVLGFFQRTAGKIGKTFLDIRSELKKVVWPTRKELIAYTTVVLFFVLVMAGIIAAYDFVFTEGVLLIFG